MVVVELTIITSPLRKYLQVDGIQLTKLDLHDLKADFRLDDNPTAGYWRESKWLFEWTSPLRIRVLKRITDHGGAPLIIEKYLPRLHEISWQKANYVKEIV